MLAAVQVDVLGAVAVRDGSGVPVALGGHRQRRLLALLVRHRGSVVPVDVAVEALWGDGDLPANPVAALHSVVARLRRSLAAAGDGAVLATEPAGYCLRLAPERVDAAVFEALLAEAALDATPPATAVELLARALGVWRGSAYGEFAEVEELRLEGNRLDELRVVAEERLGAALLAAGRATDAIAHLERVAAAHPLREAPVELLMRSMADVGRHADALRRFQRHREHLADELGLQPSLRLRRLERSLLGDGPGDDVERLGGGPTAGGASDEDVGVLGPGGGLDEMTVTYVASGRHPEIPLAVGRAGHGERVVAVPAWVTSIDVIAANGDPRSALLERLAGSAQVVVYDQPGTGLSRGPVTDFGLEGAVADLAAVVDHVGGRPVTLLAMSAAGPAALTFAARHPHLVRALVLFGTFADPAVAFPDRTFSEALLGVVRARWGRGASMVAQLYRPGVGDEGAARLGTILRDSADADVGVGYLAAVYESDASDVVGRVTRPALVIHYRDDKVVPFAGGQHLAASLPDARFVALEGGYHLPDVRDVDRLERLVRSFLADIDGR